MRQGRSLANPGPGTIVDHTITKKTIYDFFLVPQKVGQGTVTPSHFVSVSHLSHVLIQICQQILVI